MTIPSEIRTGDVVWVEGGGKVRPAVVVRVLAPAGPEPVPGEQRVRILCPWGTGTLRADKSHVRVMPGTAAGFALGLEKPTYFYRGNLTVCDAQRAQRTGRRCPPELFIELSRLVGL
jgi:hypothetical protein